MQPKSLFDLCVDTLRKSNTSSELTASDTLINFDDLLSYKALFQEEVRLFVGGSLNYGHQATSINIMHRLISRGVQLIHIVYQASTNTSPDYKDEPTTKKLANLIPDLTEGDIAHGRFTYIYDGNPVTLLFSSYESFSTTDTVTLGFSGGFDATYNSCRQLGVKCLIVLQPFRYKKKSAKNMLYFHPDLFPTDNELDLGEPFIEKGFYLDDPVKPTEYMNEDAELLKQTLIDRIANKALKGLKKQPLWTDEPTILGGLKLLIIRDESDTKFQNQLSEQLYKVRHSQLEEIKIDLAATLKREVEPSDIKEFLLKQFIEEYGQSENALQKIVARKLDNPQWKRLTVTTALTLLEKQQIDLCPVYFSEGRTRFGAPTILFNLLTGLLALPNRTKPIVILSMSSFSDNVYDVLRTLLSGKLEYWDETSQEAKAQSARNWSPFVCKRVWEVISQRAYFNEMKAVQIIHSGASLAAVLNKVGPTGIVFVDLKRLPKPVFDYLYFVNTLPSLFEGEGSASAILNWGRPYFHVLSLNVEAHETLALYPYPVIPSELLGQAKTAKYCTTFFNNFGDQVWLDNEDPDEAIKKFIQDSLPAVTITEITYLQLYFKSLRSFFHNEKEDKLIKALLFAWPEIKKRRLDQ